MLQLVVAPVIRTCTNTDELDGVLDSNTTTQLPVTLGGAVAGGGTVVRVARISTTVFCAYWAVHPALGKVHEIPTGELIA